MAEIQKEVLWLCEVAHVPAVWANHILESLAKKGIQSRPKITDAAIRVSVECVMLNKGPHIVETVIALDDIVVRMQAHIYKEPAPVCALCGNSYKIGLKSISSERKIGVP